MRKNKKQGRKNSKIRKTSKNIQKKIGGIQNGVIKKCNKEIKKMVVKLQNFKKIQKIIIQSNNKVMRQYSNLLFWLYLHSYYLDYYLN